MIRMGRSNKTEPTTPNVPAPQTQEANTGLGFQKESFQSSRAVSESESMARDIKEGRLSGFVGNGTVLTGDTNFQSMLRIDGHLTGSVSSDSGTLVIGSTGRVDANIKVASALINGTVNGDIIATEKIELGRTAKVIGNIQTPRIMIEEGAVFEGNCTMQKARESFDKKAAQNKSHYEEEKAEAVAR